MTVPSKPLKELFLSALEVPADDRTEWLDHECAGDMGLREQLNLMLAAHDAPHSLLDQPSMVKLGATIDQPITEKPGTQIGPYKLLQQIGEGGMGVVYMAEQTEPVQRRVALKIIKPGMDTQQVIARFEAERQALAMMDHPNIAKVLDAGTTETGRPYFVMELVKGMPVTQYCDEENLTPKERLELFLPICQAVQHAHQKGIIHRDLKPTNILVSQYDNKAVPKVIDFGVAKAISQKLTEKTMFTHHGQIVGTVDYMSPEQAQFNQLDVDTRSDVYSLGVLLYELLTGETPFDKQRLRSAAFDELLRIIRDEEPPKPSLKLSSSQSLPTIAANRHIDPQKLSMLVRGELDWIVMKALDKDRNRRYETATSFADDIQHYLHDEPVTACPPSAAYKFRKFARRNKMLIGTTTAIALTLIAGIAGTTWQSFRATAEAERANKEAHRADEEADKARTEAAIAQAVSDFLNTDLLGMADAAAQAEANLSPDPNLKVRTLLDRAAENLDGRFPDQPLVEAAIRNTIGNTYRLIGAFEKAEEQTRRAMELRKRELGVNQLETLRSMHLLAIIFYEQGRYVDAEQLHRQTLAIKTRVLGPDHPATLASMSSLAVLYRFQGRYLEAEQLCRRTLDLQRRTLGDEHPHTLISMNNLANIYRNLCRFKDAESVLLQALEIRQRTQGNEHPHTLNLRHDLATVYHEEGRYTEAEQLYRETLKIRERTQGHDHPETLLGYTNLANLYKDEGKYDQAEQLHQQVLEIKRRTLRAEHPSILTSMNNLAAVYSAQGRSADAERLDQQTLDIKRRTLGEEHPDTLLTMNNLASVYHDLGRYKDAIRLYQKVLEIERRTLGNEHPLTLASQSGLADVVVAQGRYTEAEELHQQILTIRRRLLGEEHPDTLSSMNRLAGIYRTQGRFDEARKLREQVLEIRRRKLGEQHPYTLVSMVNLGTVYRDQAKYTDAEQLFRQALETQQRTLGDDHPDTIGSMRNLAGLYYDQGQFDEAEKLYQQVLGFRRRRLGEEHPLTLTSMNNLAIVYRNQRRFSEAEQLLRQSLKLQQQILGGEHPDTLVSQSNLALVFYSEGRYEEAEQLQQQTLELRRRVLGEVHPQTMESMNDLANVYWAQDGLDEAETLHRQTLELRRKILGDEHPSTLDSMNNLAGVYFDRGKFDEAEELYRQELELELRIRGEEHRNTLDSMNDLAVVYRKQGHHSEAGQLYERMIEIQQRTLGDEHPETLASMHELALVYHTQRRYAQAEELYQRTLELRRKVLGDEDRATLQTMNNLANAYDDQRRFQEARRLHEQTLEIRRRVLGDDHPETRQSIGNLVNTLQDWAWQIAGSSKKSADDYAFSLQLAQRAVELDPKRVAAWQALGWAHYRNGNWQNSIDALEKSCELQNGGDNFQWFFLAMDHWQLGHEEEARQWYIRSVDWLYRRNMGYGYRREAEELMGLTPEDRYEMLQNHYQQAIAATPDNPRLYEVRARMHKEHHNWVAAVTDSRKAVEFYRQSKPEKAAFVKAREQLGDCLRDLGKSLQNIGEMSESEAAYREGQKVWQKLAEEFPQNQTYSKKIGDLYRQLSHALNDQGKCAEALTCLEKALEVAPNDHWSYGDLASFRLYAWDESFRDVEQAAQHAARAVELNPKQPWGYRHLGEARYRMQDWAGAAESLEKSIELGRPLDARTGFQLAICYGHLDDWEKGTDWYKQAATLMKEKTNPEDWLVELQRRADKQLETSPPQTVKN